METTIAIIIAEVGYQKKYNTVQLHRLQKESVMINECYDMETIGGQ